MSRSTLGGIILTLGIVSAIIFLIVAIHEFSYDSAHPYASGPALEIAWGGVAGALLGAALALVGIAFARQE